MMAGRVFSMYHKPNVNEKFFDFSHVRLVYANLMLAIKTHKQRAKDKKFLDIVLTITKLRSQKRDTEKAVQAFTKAKEDNERIQEKITKWTKKVNDIENKLAHREWKDFARYAALRVEGDYDDLDVMKNAMQQLDLRLLNVETRQLLEYQLGIDLNDLQKAIKEKPENIKNLLKKSFVLDDSSFVSFIKRQRAKQSAHLFPS